MYSNGVVSASYTIEVVSTAGCMSVSECPANSDCIESDTDVFTCVCRPGYTRDANNSCIGIIILNSTHLKFYFS